MDKQHLDYFNHLVNVLPADGMVIGREILHGYEHITITFENEVIYDFWHNPNSKKTDKPPKHTGGKPSYVKLMIEGISKHNELSIESAGFIVKLASNIQWGTNLIINKRSKKALHIEDITKIVGVGRNKTLQIIKELRAANLLLKDKDGYKISADFIAKGGAKK